MVDVTQPGGTAARAGADAPYTIAAKTGTAQVIGMKQGEKYDEKRVKEEHRDHALFIAFAPADDPEARDGAPGGERRPRRLAPPRRSRARCSTTTCSASARRSSRSSARRGRRSD